MKMVIAIMVLRRQTATSTATVLCNIGRDLGTDLRSGSASAAQLVDEPVADARFALGGGDGEVAWQV